MHLQKSLSIYVRMVVCFPSELLYAVSNYAVLAILPFVLQQKKNCQFVKMLWMKWMCGARVAHSFMYIVHGVVFIVPPCHLFAFAQNTHSQLYSMQWNAKLTDLFGIRLFSPDRVVRWSHRKHSFWSTAAIFATFHSFSITHCLFNWISINYWAICLAEIENYKFPFLALNQFRIQ